MDIIIIMDRSRFQTGNLSTSRTIIKFIVGKSLEGPYPVGGQVCGADVCCRILRGERERENPCLSIIFLFFNMSQSADINVFGFT